MDLSEHPIFKVALPSLPFFFYLIVIGLFFEDWHTFFCQTPATLSFWGVVILYYLSIQVATHRISQYNLVTSFFLIIIVIIWILVALLSYLFNYQLQKFEIEFISRSRYFLFSWIPSIISLISSVILFFRYEPSLMQFRKRA